MANDSTRATTMHVCDILTVEQFRSETSIPLTPRSSTKLAAITATLRQYHAEAKTNIEARHALLGVLQQHCADYLEKAADPNEARDHPYRTWKRGKRSVGVEALRDQVAAKHDYLGKVLTIENTNSDLLIQPVADMSVRDRFRRAVKAVQLLGDPAGVRLLDHHYWSEIIDPLHRPLNKPGNKEIYERWLSNRYGPNPTTTHSFYRWLETQDVAGMTASMYQTAEQREDYRIYAVHGVLAYDAAGHKLVDTSANKSNFSGGGWAIYVLSSNALLYAGTHINPDQANPVGFYHSCFLSGERVSAAGELKIVAGRLAAISPKSGHYKPKAEEVVRLLEWMDAAGCLSAESKVQWFPMRNGQLFPLTGYNKMFPVFWYSAADFLRNNGEVDGVEPLRREAQTEGGIGLTGRFVYDRQKNDADPFHFSSYVGVGDVQAVARLGWTSWL